MTTRISSDSSQISFELKPLAAVLQSEMFRANDRREADVHRREDDEMRRREEREAQARYTDGNSFYDFLKHTGKMDRHGRAFRWQVG